MRVVSSFWEYADLRRSELLVDRPSVDAREKIETRCDGCDVDTRKSGTGGILSVVDIGGSEEALIVLDLLCPGVEDVPLDMVLAFIS